MAGFVKSLDLHQVEHPVMGPRTRYPKCGTSAVPTSPSPWKGSNPPVRGALPGPGQEGLPSLWRQRDPEKNPQKQPCQVPAVDTPTLSKLPVLRLPTLRHTHMTRSGLTGLHCLPRAPRSRELTVKACVCFSPVLCLCQFHFQTPPRTLRGWRDHSLPDSGKWAGATGPRPGARAEVQGQAADARLESKPQDPLKAPRGVSTQRSSGA